MIHTFKCFNVVSEAEVDVFLEFPCFSIIQRMLAIWSLVPLPFLNPAWIPGSSWFHILLKDFEHYLASTWHEHTSTVEHSLALAFFEIGMKTDLFQSYGHCQVFQIWWHIECSTLTASSFRSWKSSAGIPSPPLAFFVVMLPKATWLHTLGCLALGEWPHHCGYLVIKTFLV